MNKKLIASKLNGVILRLDAMQLHFHLAAEVADGIEDAKEDLREIVEAIETED